MSQCPITIGAGNPAIQLTSEGWSTFQGFAQSAFALATQNIASLTSFTVDGATIPGVGSFSPTFGTFTPPPVPSAPNLETTGYSDPGEPPVVNIQIPEFTEIAEFTGVAPPIVPGREPVLRVTDPGNPPPLNLPDPIDPPEPELPDEPPEMLPVVIPPPPDIDNVEFEGVPPDSSLIEFPNMTFSYTYEEYTRELLDQVKSRLQSMLQGGTGLPAPVEDALRSRAYADVDREELRAVNQASAEVAARGFDEPNGIMLERVKIARSEARDKRYILNRDIYIRAQEVEIENLRFAVQQGLAYEAQTIALHLRAQEMILDAAKFERDTALAILNAKIAVFNAEVERYKADAQVYRDRVQAELAKVELYRAEIEAQKTINEVNKVSAEIYATQVRAAMTEVEIYVAQMNGLRAWAEIEVAKIEAYRAKVQAYGERVQAYVAEWGGYRARIEAEIAKQRAFEVSVQAYAANVQAAVNANQNKIEFKRLELGISEAQIRAYIARLEHMRTQIQAEGQRWSAQGAVYQGQAAIYGASGQVAQAQAATGNQAAQIAVAAYDAQSRNALAQAQIITTEAIQRAGLLLEAIKGATAASAQLAGASMSAVNFSAGVGYNAAFTDSQGCTTSYNYQGEID